MQTFSRLSIKMPLLSKLYYNNIYLNITLSLLKILYPWQDRSVNVAFSNRSLLSSQYHLSAAFTYLNHLFHKLLSQIITKISIKTIDGIVKNSWQKLSTELKLEVSINCWSNTIILRICNETNMNRKTRYIHAQIILGGKAKEFCEENACILLH